MTSGQKVIAMWLEKGTKELFLKFILDWIWLDSGWKLSDIAVDFLE